MSKCIECKKLEAVETWKDKLTSWLIHHIFPKTLKDEKTHARLEGFTDAYKISGKYAQELKQLQYQLERLEYQINQLILQVIKNNLPSA